MGKKEDGKEISMVSEESSDGSGLVSETLAEKCNVLDFIGCFGGGLSIDSQFGFGCTAEETLLISSADGRL